MQLLSLAQSISPSAPSVVTVGNFDGVHRGHQALLGHVVRRARAREAISMAVTFEPHTRTVLSPGAAVPLLTTLEEKRAIIEKLGIDILLWIPFDAAIAAMTAERFVHDLLISRLGAVEWVMGEGHTWGINRSGRLEILQNLVSGKHFSVFVCSLAAEKSGPVSSTDIRARILRGDIDAAVEALGHPYVVSARRIRGAGRASQLGFPTLNFEKPRAPKALPPSGVYAGVLQFEQREFQGAIYFGDCPTYQRQEPRFEFHSLAALEKEPAVGQEARLWIHRQVRTDRAFAQETELQQQMTKDIETVRRFFSRE